MLSMMSSSSSDTTMNDADAGRLDKYYETQCILEGRVKPTMNEIDFSDEVHAFAALFNNGYVLFLCYIEDREVTPTVAEPCRLFLSKPIPLQNNPAATLYRLTGRLSPGFLTSKSGEMASIKTRTGT